MGNAKYNCAKCIKNYCYHRDVEHAYPTCPSKAEEEGLSKALGEYKDEDLKFAQVAAEVAVDRYGGKSRIEETIDFIRRMGYHKVGLAFCYALKEEARLFANLMEATIEVEPILTEINEEKKKEENEKESITVESLICKVGSVGREKLDLKDFNTASIPMCNPIAQAEFLNNQKTELNILLGLCIGHDTLFIKYSDAPVTILAVKDRLYKHNPVEGFTDEKGYCIKTLKEKRPYVLKKNN